MPMAQPRNACLQRNGEQIVRKTACVLAPIFLPWPCLNSSADLIERQLCTNCQFVPIMGKNASPELQPKQKKEAASGDISAQNTVGKNPPAFSLSAEPIQAKTEGGLLEAGAELLQSGMDWLSNWWNGGGEAKTADKVDGTVDPEKGDAAPKLAAGPGGDSKAPANVPANLPPAKDAPAKAPDVVEGDEKGAAVNDDKVYYVTSSTANIRKNEDPTKTTPAKLPPGAKVKRVRELGNVSQVEIIDNMGNSSVTVGGKYWTTTSNIAASEKVTDTQLHWNHSSVTPKAGPGVGASKAAMARETLCHIVEKITVGKKEYYRIVSEDLKADFGWVETKYILLAAKDRSDNFSWMGATTWKSSDATVDPATLKTIQDNRTGVNNHNDEKTYNMDAYSQALRKTGPGYIYSDPTRDIKIDVEGKNDIEKKVNQIIYNELMKEGSWSSINTYDGEIFTWGKGFAATGALNVVLDELLKVDPKYLAMFRQVGIDVVGGRLQVLGDDGKVYADKKGDYAGAKQIQKSVQLQSFFIELGEKKEFREDVAKAQYRAIMKTAGKWPAYVVDQAAGKFADSWDEASVAMLAHLSHWLSAGSWSHTDYSSTKGDMASVIYKFMYTSAKAAKQVAPRLAEGVYNWNNDYAIMTKLTHFGNPKGDALTKFNTQYPTGSYEKEIEIKKVGDKSYAYLKGENKYLKDVIIVKTGEGKYRVVTPIGDTVEGHTVAGPETETPK
jgi:hypothetical protein